MNKLSSNQIREIWLKYFKENDHLELESASLIPINDPTLLWINSGVATLKNYFSGKENPPHYNLTNSQKSIRTNDIFNVGITSRHHTFFEMLGNFSIGGYFKEKAIKLAYDLLLNIFKISQEKLYFTVYIEDEIAYKTWIELGIDKHHIIKCDRDRNFWDVGSGPCGPCTEIYYDRGNKFDVKNIGEKLFFEDIENDRYVEIWNIVFSEFNNDGKNNYTPLLRKNIDTGAGLERLACIFQDVPTNFDTDLFINTIRMIEKKSDKKYSIESFFTDDKLQSKINLAYKVIADHSRAVVMAIADGAVPSNKERGYILRRLIRRVVIKLHYLGIEDNIFYDILTETINTMLSYYPYLNNQKDRIISILNNEFNIFQKTLKAGFKLFFSSIDKKFDKNIIFKLVETYGFPIELIQELANENNIIIDIDGFNELFKQHQLKSNVKTKNIAMLQQNNELMNFVSPSLFLYDTYHIDDVKIIKMFDENFNSIDDLENSGWIAFDKTCFYATGGGQLHDTGYINHSYEVDEVIKCPNGQNLHHVTNVDKLSLNDNCLLEINKENREFLTRNHSVEHLIHATLVKHIDSSIKQEGAFKSPEKVTFDFQYHNKLSSDQLELIESSINIIINKSIPVDFLSLSLEEAKAIGAMAYFEEVYKKIKGNLRVVKMSNESTEICGGTHVKNTNEIQQFKIINYFPNGSGSWRIEAITSFITIQNYEKNYFIKINNELEEMVNFLNKNNFKDNTIQSFIDEIKKTELLNLKIESFNKFKIEFIKVKFNISKEISNKEINLIKKEINNNDLIIIKEFNNFDNKNIFLALSDLINEYKENIFIFFNIVDNKTQYLLGCNQEYSINKKINLNNLIKTINNFCNGKGGGKPNMVQGGCNGNINISKIKEIILKELN